MGLVLFNSTAHSQVTLELRDSMFKAMHQEEDTFTKLDLRYKCISLTEPFYLDSILYYLELWENEYDEQGYTFGMARMRSLRSWYLNYWNEHEKALKLAHSALALQDSLKDTLGISRTLNRIGTLNLQFKRYDQGALYLNKSLDMALEAKDTALIDMCLNNLAIVYSNQKQFVKAVEYHRRCYELRSFKRDTFWMAFSLYNIAEAYYESGIIDSSGVYYKRSVKHFQKAAQRDIVPAMVHSGMAKYYAAIGQPEMALPHAEKAVEKARKRGLKDSEIEGMRILADVQFKAGQHKKAYETLEAFEQLREKVDSANNATEVAKIEEKYKNAQQEAEISQLEANNLEIESKAQKSKFKALVASLLALALAIIAIVFITLTNIKKKTDQRVQKASFDKKVSDLKLMALQAQMNPHFIFNCINTAQNFIIKTEREKAYEYLAQFAKLIRNVLENSSKVYIPIQDEIDQIKQYVELEAVRFDGKFSYNMSIDEALNQGVFELPTMIIQPCVENAIIHGLVNRTEDGGRLDIRLSLKGSLIHIEIEDNGVGRERALEIKQSKRHHYSSTATMNIRNRLDIIQQNTSEKIQYEVTDLRDETGACGTRVFIAVPYR